MQIFTFTMNFPLFCLVSWSYWICFFFFFELKLNWSVLFIVKCQGRSRLFMRHGKVTANASNVGVGSGGFEESQGNDNQNFISNGSSSDNSSDMWVRFSIFLFPSTKEKKYILRTGSSILFLEKITMFLLQSFFPEFSQQKTYNIVKVIGNINESRMSIVRTSWWI